MKSSDIYLFISFLLIIAAMIIFTYYMYTENVNECTRDPIKFGINKIRYMYDADTVRGEIIVVKDLQERRWFFGDEWELNYSKKN